MNKKYNTVFAEALTENNKLKKGIITGESVGVKNAREWNNAIKAMRLPAYGVREYRYNHMGDAAVAAAVDQSAFFNALRPIIDLIGEVNGAKLHPENLADEIYAHAMCKRAIDLTPEMAHARRLYNDARKAKDEDETEENIATFEECKAEVDRLEAIPGNCKYIAVPQSPSYFVKNVIIVLSDAVSKQCAKPMEQVIAEEKARDDARKARAKARKQANKTKKQAENTAA